MSSNTVESATQILTIEGNFSAWLNCSIILLTASLVFFHMSKVGSIKVPIFLSGFISCSLIITNIIYTINSIIPYYNRTSKKFKGKDEIYYRNVYFYTSIFFVFIEIIICIYMIKDSLKSSSGF